MRLLLSPPDAPTVTPGERPVEEVYTASLDDGRHLDRPWVMLSMVASIDGSTVVDGSSGGISGAVDSAVLVRLRSLADVILVGAGTARSEGYGPPSKPGQRIGVVTRSGHVDVTSPLFTSGSGFVVTTTSTSVAAGVDVVRAGDDEVDLAEALRRLHGVTDQVRVVQAEGGPSLNGALLDADLVDEIDVTTSPHCVGGGGPRLAVGALDVMHRYEVCSLAMADDFVFTRWRRRQGG